MKRVRGWYLVLLLAGSVTGCLAQGSDASSDNSVGLGDMDPAPYLGGTQTFPLASSTTGREYQVSVAVPLGYDESQADYPVLYGVDANGQFGILVETARILRIGEQAPPIIIVGIGYPVGGYQTNSSPRRLLELSPAVIDSFIEKSVEAQPDQPPPEGSGGAPELLRFITDDVVPFIEERYRTRPGDRALYGHSLGGAFALYALLHGNGAFSRFIIASPSLWWGDGVAFDQEAAYASSHERLQARVFFSVGLSEYDDARPLFGSGRMVTNLRRFLAVLETRQYKGLVWQSHFFEDENHQSVLPAAVSRGLRYIYSEQ